MRNLWNPRKHPSCLLRFFEAPLCVLLFFVLLSAGMPPAFAETETPTELKKIEQERARLTIVRERLEKQLGSLGHELKTLDSALVGARAASRQAGERTRQADVALTQLLEKQRRLKERVARLRRQMQDEVAVAYRQAGSRRQSLLALQNASVAEIPHRQYMLSRLLASQQRDRQEYVDGLKELARLEDEARLRRDDLEKFRIQKKEAEARLTEKRQAKRAMWRRVKQDAQLTRQRDRQLALQEEALRKLLAGLGARLSVEDEAVSWVSVRKQKGALPWPIKGKIVRAFGTRPAPDRPGLAGVQLAPRGHARQVKSIAAGQVRYADWFGGYGLMMIVDHGDGLMSVYAHNDAFLKRFGDWVQAGEVLAEAGSTGWVESVLLYFELRDAGKAVNPARWCSRK